MAYAGFKVDIDMAADTGFAVDIGVPGVTVVVATGAVVEFRREADFTEVLFGFTGEETRDVMAGMQPVNHGAEIKYPTFGFLGFVRYQSRVVAGNALLSALVVVVCVYLGDAAFDFAVAGDTGGICYRVFTCGFNQLAGCRNIIQRRREHLVCNRCAAGILEVIGAQEQAMRCAEVVVGIHNGGDPVMFPSAGIGTWLGRIFNQETGIASLTSGAIGAIQGAIHGAAQFLSRGIIDPLQRRTAARVIAHGGNGVEGDLIQASQRDSLP